MPHLTFPNTSHKEKYLAMIDEWWASTSPWRLFVWESYEDFLRIITTDLTANPNGVNSSFFFFMYDEEILGAIHIRHHIDNPWLSLDGGGSGHIGYGLRPSARGKWLSWEMLLLWLEEAKKLNLTEVIVSAYEDNPASWKTIEKCGWVFLKKIEKEWRYLKIYTIAI